MSGHSKWSTIKRRKGVVDAKRAALFTRLTKEVTVAAKEGGGDPSANPSLRAAIDKAKAGNVPNKNIDRAVARGAGTLAGMNMTEFTYEGYGPGGVGLMIIGATDNANRTVSEVRSTFNKLGGSMGAAGSVSYIFADSLDTPTFKIPLEESDREKLDNLVEALQDLDDVDEIYHNADI